MKATDDRAAWLGRYIAELESAAFDVLSFRDWPAESLRDCPKSRAALDRLLRALMSRTGKPAWEPTHRHRKGGLYRELHRGLLEADLTRVVIYEDRLGNVWVRPAREFDDGRFVRLAVGEGRAGS